MSRISRDEPIAIDTNSVQAAPERPKRVGWMITNNSVAATAYIRKGDTPASSTAPIVGLPLKAGGVMFDFDSGEGYRCWRGAIQVAGSAAGSIQIQEDMEV